MTDAPVKIERIVHTIHAVADIAACRALYLDVLGGLIFSENYFEAEDRDATLLYVANHMVEPMAPRDAKNLEKPYARYLSRFGQGFHSFEMKIAEGQGPAAAAKFKAAGYKLASDYGIFFFVRQESTGVLVEATAVPMPNDPYDRRNWRGDYAEGHASTLSRLDHIACIVPDLKPILAFFTGQVEGELLSDERIAAPQSGRRVLIRLADTKIAFIQPDDTGSGPLGTFLKPPTSGVYALVWRVENASAAEAFFTKKNLRTTREACISKGFAIDPRDFMGARHEFIG